MMYPPACMVRSHRSPMSILQCPSCHLRLSRAMVWSIVLSGSAHSRPRRHDSRLPQGHYTGKMHYCIARCLLPRSMPTHHPMPAREQDIPNACSHLCLSLSLGRNPHTTPTISASIVLFPRKCDRWSFPQLFLYAAIRRAHNGKQCHRYRLSPKEPAVGQLHQQRYKPLRWPHCCMHVVYLPSSSIHPRSLLDRISPSDGDSFLLRLWLSLQTSEYPILPSLRYLGGKLRKNHFLFLSTPLFHLGR